MTFHWIRIAGDFRHRWESLGLWVLTGFLDLSKEYFLSSLNNKIDLSKSLKKIGFPRHKSGQCSFSSPWSDISHLVQRRKDDFLCWQRFTIGAHLWSCESKNGGRNVFSGAHSHPQLIAAAIYCWGMGWKGVLDTFYEISKHTRSGALQSDISTFENTFPAF